jgi:hypothetical protein
MCWGLGRAYACLLEDGVVAVYAEKLPLSSAIQYKHLWSSIPSIVRNPRPLSTSVFCQSRPDNSRCSRLPLYSPSFSSRLGGVQLQLSTPHRYPTNLSHPLHPPHHPHTSQNGRRLLRSQRATQGHVRLLPHTRKAPAIPPPTHRTTTE